MVELECPLIVDPYRQKGIIYFVEEISPCGIRTREEGWLSLPYELTTWATHSVLMGVTYPNCRIEFCRYKGKYRADFLDIFQTVDNSSIR